MIATKRSLSLICAIALYLDFVYCQLLDQVICQKFMVTGERVNLWWKVKLEKARSGNVGKADLCGETVSM